MTPSKTHFVIAWLEVKHLGTFRDNHSSEELVLLISFIRMHVQGSRYMATSSVEKFFRIKNLLGQGHRLPERQGASL